MIDLLGRGQHYTVCTRVYTRIKKFSTVRQKYVLDSASKNTEKQQNPLNTAEGCHCIRERLETGNNKIPYIQKCHSRRAPNTL